MITPIAPATGNTTTGTYARFDGTRLMTVDAETEIPAPAVAQFVHDSFRALVLNPHFACVAAKSAFNRDNYRYGVYDAPLGSAEAANALGRHLEQFAREQNALRENGYSTFVASFTGPALTSEEEFERLLWDTLQHLHEQDASRFAWDPTVSDDPEDPHFEWSFAGRAFFVVGLHPAASRLTRRFAFPTLVFNAHFQFDELRTAGKYGRMQDVIRGRDRTLQGSINPNLADFGESSDARQYAGRAVSADWQCPFHTLRSGASALGAEADLDTPETDAEGNLQ